MMAGKQCEYTQYCGARHLTNGYNGKFLCYIYLITHTNKRHSHGVLHRGQMMIWPWMPGQGAEAGISQVRTAMAKVGRCPRQAWLAQIAPGSSRQQGPPPLYANGPGTGPAPPSLLH